MPVQCSTEGRTLIAAVTGEVDHHSARSLMMDLERGIELELPHRVVLDLSGVTFMDSSGIAVILRVQRLAQELGGGVTVTHLPAQAAKVLRTAGLERLVEIEP